ncbi:hypothetical protein PoB_003399500 [Plakobranchus ocellatus]|uniref:Uncharacterized protein n=1 Tax=Plakobranchus ocellatus TaxID=259542 RepID=A0AAV4AJH6_9GAST|nr:hypothetical protein PoB_003399500 [Plakobranchus ocellatus]
MPVEKHYHVNKTKYDDHADSVNNNADDDDEDNYIDDDDDDDNTFLMVLILMMQGAVDEAIITVEGEVEKER